MKIKRINKANYKMAFTELSNVIDEKIFSRLKEENVSVEDSHDIVWEVIDNELNEMCIIDVEYCLFDVGFFHALELYDSEYGLDSLKGMDKIRRVKCLLQCAIRDVLVVDMEEKYVIWCKENKGEDEDEGEGEETTN